MHWRKKQLLDSKLYVILDREVADYKKLFEIAQDCVAAGVDIMQLRDKKGCAREILEFSKAVLKFSRRRTLYIINDRVDLALMADADGVHLGQDDIPVALARKYLNKDQLVGVSCQNLKHILSAQKSSADCIGFGSMFKTKTKPNRQPMKVDLIKDVVKVTKVPLFAIGGINLENASGLIDLGIDRLAICRSICESRDGGKTIKQFKKIIKVGS